MDIISVGSFILLAIVFDGFQYLKLRRKIVAMSGSGFVFLNSWVGTSNLRSSGWKAMVMRPFR